MTTWHVCITYDASVVVEVEAETEEEAKEKAFDNAHVSLCHHCAHELDLGDPVDAVEAWKSDAE